MRKLLTSLLLICCIQAFLIESASAGLMLGVKGWYADWDSATSKAIADSMVSYLKAYDSTWDINATAKPGNGYLVGPMLGYQTEDKVWSFSMALMMLNKFNQKTDVTVTISGTPVKMDVTNVLDRKDYDFSASYLLSNSFKVVAGFKYMTANYNIDYQIQGYAKKDYMDIKTESYIPALGIAFAAPLSEKLAFSIQAGVLYIMPKFTETGTKINVDNSLGVNVEPSLSLLVSENFLLQAGIRYQIYEVKFNEVDMNFTKVDQFIGFTFSAVFLF